MSELKCPFCKKKLEPIGTSGQFQCGTWGCDASFNFYATRDVWEYIDHTRKALEWARHFLKEIRLRYLIEKDEPSRQNKWADTALYMYNCAESFFDDYDKTAYEQKESAFVHNKIEFPEYNDNLLEEFDKQFFENGQDDDLTETALEQKDVK